MNEEERLELRNWGLPELVLMRYQQKGITRMFPWQAECLGKERATPEVMNAWGEGYWFLAKLLIAKEKEAREANERKKGK